MLCEHKSPQEIQKLDADLEGEGSDAEIRLQASAQQEMAALLGMANAG